MARQTHPPRAQTRLHRASPQQLLVRIHYQCLELRATPVVRHSHSLLKHGSAPATRARIHFLFAVQLIRLVRQPSPQRWLRILHPVVVPRLEAALCPADLPHSMDALRSAGMPRLANVPRSVGAPRSADALRSANAPRSAEAPHSAGAPHLVEAPRSAGAPRPAGALPSATTQVVHTRVPMLVLRNTPSV